MKTSDLHDVNLNSAQNNPRLGFCAAQKNLSLGFPLLSAQRGPKSWLRYSSLGISLPRLGLWKISKSGLMGSGGLVLASIWNCPFVGEIYSTAFFEDRKSLRLKVKQIYLSLEAQLVRLFMQPNF